MNNTRATPVDSRPYWWLEAAPSPLPVQPVAKTCDVAIVGGGYAGLSAAITLARAGRSVQLFDRQDVGAGASSLNGGMASGSIRPGRQELIRKFGEERANAILLEGKAAREDLRRFLDDEKIDCDFSLTGLFDGALDVHEYDALARNAELLARALGIEAFAVRPEEQKAYIGTDFYRGGMVRKDIGGLHPAKLVREILRCALGAGAVVHDRTAVEAIHCNTSGYSLKTARGVVAASEVVVCTNGYTDGFDPWLRRRLVPVRSRIIATQPLPPPLMDRLMPSRMMHGDGRKLSYYYRPSPDGRCILFGGRDGTTEGDSMAPTLHLRSELARLFPELGNVGLMHSWFGNVAMNRNMIPRLFTRKGIVYATGFCGSGVVWARWLGQKAARRILGDAEGARSAFDLDAPPPAIPLYNGRPWFIPIVYSLYERQDRRALRRRDRAAGDA